MRAKNEWNGIDCATKKKKRTVQLGKAFGFEVSNRNHKR